MGGIDEVAAERNGASRNLNMVSSVIYTGSSSMTRRQKTNNQATIWPESGR
jgi:hypothetical protein